MRIRTLALALALCCGLTVAAEARNTTVNRVKPRKFKAPKNRKVKHNRMKPSKHKVRR